MLYRTFFRLVLGRLPAETAHRLSFGLLRLIMAVPGVKLLTQRLLGPRDHVLRVHAFGFDFPSPLGLAAGFDKDGKRPDALGALGFGFVEVGTLTALAQPGNPRPRLFRLPADRALVNRMGFNNGGSPRAARRLARRLNSPVVVGVNIGKTKAVSEERAVADYAASAARLAGVSDYLVVNVSSPNTPGLRDLQAVPRLRPLLVAVREALDRTSGQPVPLLVKIAPDLADADIDAVADLALSLRIDGIIATNTTTSRDGLQSPPEQVAAAGAGGLSGAPLRARSLEVLRRLKARVGERLVLISAGGVEDDADVWERLAAGATLVQAYTGFVYGGPLWPRRVNKGLAARVRQSGFDSVGHMVAAGRAPGRTRRMRALPAGLAGSAAAAALPAGNAGDAPPDWAAGPARPASAGPDPAAPAGPVPTAESAGITGSIVGENGGTATQSPGAGHRAAALRPVRFDPAPPQPGRPPGGQDG